jgi:hypothetical protein
MLDFTEPSSGSDLGSLVRKVSSQGTVVCPLPRSWYPLDSQCSQSDEVITGAPRAPWIAPEDKAGLRAAWEGLSAFPTTLKKVGWLVVGLTVLWLTVRGVEAYASFKTSR